MTDFRIKVAGIPAGVSAVYESTERFCADYLTDDEPVISVAVCQEDIDAERERSKEQDKREGIPVRSFSDAYLETLALYRKLASGLLAYDAVIFHGSAVAYDGRAYVFTAPSGTGKTTHSRLWMENIQGAYVLNGDKPLLRIVDGEAYACGTPWQGKENMGCNEMLPLEAICQLERSDVNRIEEAGAGEMLGTLLRQMHIPEGSDTIVKALEITGRIVENVRLYRLGCNMEPEAARVSFQAMHCENPQ